MKSGWLAAAMFISAFFLVNELQACDSDPNAVSIFGAGEGLAATNYTGDLGAHWARVPIEINPDNATNLDAAVFPVVDGIVSNFQAQQIVPYVIINPHTNAAGAWPNSAQFALAVSNLAERYNGDGHNDMPGLRYGVKTWELISRYSSQASATYTNLSRADFIAMMIQGQSALKAVSSGSELAYNPFDAADTQALLSQLAPEHIDIVAYHTYSPVDAPLDSNSVTYLRNLPDYLRNLGLNDKPVWATEFALDEHQGASPTNITASQADNARWFIQTAVYGFASNLFDRLIYSEIECPVYVPTNDRLAWMALVDQAGVPRPIYYAYRKLAALMDQYSSIQALGTRTNGITSVKPYPPLPAVSNVYAYLVTANATNVNAFLWTREGAGTNSNVTVTNLIGSRGTLYSAVPDTNGNFQMLGAVTISNRQAVISTLTQVPLILAIEPEVPPAPAYISASDGDYTYKVYVTWQTAPWAAGYEIWRNTTNELATATYHGTCACSGYYDTTAVPGALYYYWVRATNALGASGFSASDSGWRRRVADMNIGGGDYDGDRITDPVVYNKNDGSWKIMLSASGYITVTAALGGWGFYPFPADFDGDRLMDPAVFNAGNGEWRVLLSQSGYTLNSFTFAGAGYRAYPADFDGDGKADIMAYGEAAGVWLVRLSASGYGTATVSFGAQGYCAAAADYDGDQRMDFGIYRESAGAWLFMLSGSGYAGCGAQLGGMGWTPAPGDYDGDRKADPAIYQEATGAWQILLSNSGYAAVPIVLGGEGYTPIPADFDGDGKADPAVYKESGSSWMVLLSSAGYAQGNLKF